MSVLPGVCGRRRSRNGVTLNIISARARSAGALHLGGSADARRAAEHRARRQQRTHHVARKDPLWTPLFSRARNTSEQGPEVPLLFLFPPLVSRSNASEPGPGAYI
jgi:hypothetical protein